MEEVNRLLHAGPLSLSTFAKSTNLEEKVPLGNVTVQRGWNRGVERFTSMLCQLLCVASLRPKIDDHSFFDDLTIVARTHAPPSSVYHPEHDCNDTNDTSEGEILFFDTAFEWALEDSNAFWTLYVTVNKKRQGEISMTSFHHLLFTNGGLLERFRIDVVDSYCSAAKQWILDYFSGDASVVQYVAFENPPQGIVDELKATTGQYTFPFIFCGTTFIGGYSELSDYHNTTKVLEREYGVSPEF